MITFAAEGDAGCLRYLLSLYLDSNIYVNAHVEDRSASVSLVEAATDGAFTVVASDRLVGEVYELFRKLFGKGEASWMRASILALPALRVVDEHQWRRSIPTVKPFVRDVSDLPHFAAAWAAAVDVMVSINRRSIEEPMFDLVPLSGPEPVAEALEGSRPWPTREEMLDVWKEWARKSARAPPRRRRGH